MSTKKQIRRAFRQAVFARDEYRCVCCKKEGFDRQLEPVASKIPLDAHHITNRNEFEFGGYNFKNGISVCDECHCLAEKFHRGEPVPDGFRPEDLYQMIGSSVEEARKLDAQMGA